MRSPTLILSAFALVALSPLAASAADVPLLPVQTASTTSSLQIDGVIQPVRQATVAAQVGGSVVALAIKAGDRVKTGQVLARIDARDTQALLAQGDAALARAQAEARNAQLNLERTRELRAQGFVSQAALDVAETQAKAAGAGVQQAQAARSQAALARGFAAVTAPFDGVVLATHLDAGDLAAPGRAVATIYAPGALRAVVQVGVSRAAVVRAASKVRIEMPDGRLVAPSRRTELSSTDPVSQTVEWRLDLPADALSGLVPGQMVRVHFEGAAAATAQTGPLRVPAAALLRRGELTAVYVAQDGRFVLRAVRLGADRGADGVEVLSGLKPGDRVAADAVRAGLADARPGQ